MTDAIKEAVFTVYMEELEALGIFRTRSKDQYILAFKNAEEGYITSLAYLLRSGAYTRVVSLSRIKQISSSKGLSDREAEEIEYDVVEALLRKGFNVIIDSNKAGFLNWLNLKILAYFIRVKFTMVPADKLAKLAERDQNEYFRAVSKIGN